MSNPPPDYAAKSTESKTPPQSNLKSKPAGKAKNKAKARGREIERRAKKEVKQQKKQAKAQTRLIARQKREQDKQAQAKINRVQVEPKDSPDKLASKPPTANQPKPPDRLLEEALESQIPDSTSQEPIPESPKPPKDSPIVQTKSVESDPTRQTTTSAMSQDISKEENPNPPERGSRKGKVKNPASPRRRSQAAGLPGRQLRRRSTPRSSARVFWVGAGVLLVIASISIFIYLLSNAEDDKTTVLVARSFIQSGDFVNADNFEQVRLAASGGNVSSLSSRAFLNVALNEISAKQDIAAGTLVTRDMFSFPGDEDQQDLERRVIFSISIPSQGYAAGTPQAGDRVLLTAYTPDRAEQFRPIAVEIVQQVTGSRLTFFTVPDRAAALQSAQLTLDQENGYFILWNVSRNQSEEEILNQARQGFSRPPL